MKKIILAILLLWTGAALAANPDLEFKLDSKGVATITPKLPSGVPYDFRPYVAADGSLTLGLTYVEAGRAQLAFYSLPELKFSGGPSPVPPGPTPPPNPPPQPPPPVPPPATKTTLLLISATGDWCQACIQTKADTVPGVQTLLGDAFKTVDYTSEEAKKAYSESALVPRWALTRADGTVEKKIGYLSIDQVKAWIGGPTK